MNKIWHSTICYVLSQKNCSKKFVSLKHIALFKTSVAHQTTFQPDFTSSMANTLNILSKGENASTDTSFHENNKRF